MIVVSVKKICGVCLCAGGQISCFPRAQMLLLICMYIQCTNDFCSV